MLGPCQAMFVAAEQSREERRPSHCRAFHVEFWGRVRLTLIFSQEQFLPPPFISVSSPILDPDRETQESDNYYYYYYYYCCFLV